MKLLCSDPHEQPFKGEKFKTQKRNIIERIIQHFADKAEEKKKQIFQQMKEIVIKKSIDSMLINGDFFEPTATERGMREYKDLVAAKQLRSEWSLGLTIPEENMEFNGGNHEFGYKLPLGTDPMAGIYRKSIDNFLRFVGRQEIYHSFMVAGFRIILVPYLFSETEAVDFNLQGEKDKFLERMRKDLENSDRALIFLHDPDSLDDQNLVDLMKMSMSREKTKGVFFGHYHAKINFLFAQILMKIYTRLWLIIPRLIFNLLILIVSRERRKIKVIEDYFRRRRNIPSLVREFNAVLIPAPAGFFGIGGEFLILDLFEDGRIVVEKHKIKREKGKKV